MDGILLVTVAMVSPVIRAEPNRVDFLVQNATSQRFSEQLDATISYTASFHLSFAGSTMVGVVRWNLPEQSLACLVVVSGLEDDDPDEEAT